jgi:hypothetical protein
MDFSLVCDGGSAEQRVIFIEERDPYPAVG